MQKYNCKTVQAFSFLAITVDENAAILARPDTFGKKYFEFLN